MAKCILCERIKEQVFPFTASLSGKYFIDSEYCIEDFGPDGLVPVRYCPYCGTSLIDDTKEEE